MDALVYDLTESYRLERYQDMLLLIQAAETEFSEVAKVQNGQLYEYIWESSWAIFEPAELNLMAVVYYWKIRLALDADDIESAQADFDYMQVHFGYGQCWDSRGAFAKPLLDAKQLIDEYLTTEHNEKRPY